MHHFHHTFIGMGSDESEQPMRLHPNAHRLIWFFVHVGIVVLVANVVKGQDTDIRS
jgi:hypothetical protein